MEANVQTLVAGAMGPVHLLQVTADSVLLCRLQGSSTAFSPPTGQLPLLLANILSHYLAQKGAAVKVQAHLVTQDPAGRAGRNFDLRVPRRVLDMMLPLQAHAFPCHPAVPCSQARLPCRASSSSALPRCAGRHASPPHQAAASVALQRQIPGCRLLTHLGCPLCTPAPMGGPL